MTSRSLSRCLRTSLLLSAILLPAHSSAADLDWQTSITAIWQQAPHGLNSVTLSADALFSVERAGGEWFVYAEAASMPAADSVAAYFPSSNADAGSVRDGTHGGVQISELHYTFNLQNEQALQLGLLDTSAWLDVSSVANDETAYFINASLVNNATIAFPDYTLGAVFSRPGKANLPTLTFVAARSAGLADYARRKYEKLFEFGEDGSGAFIGAQADWDTTHTRTSVGLWLNSAEHPVARQPQRLRSNYGAYTTWTWVRQRHAIDARFGVAHQKVSPAARFASVAYVLDTAGGGVGIGVARTWHSSAFGEAGRDDRLDAELFYRLTVGDSGLQLTPSIQWVRNPDFDASGSSVRARATIVGLRFHWQTL